MDRAGGIRTPRVSRRSFAGRARRHAADLRAGSHEAGREARLAARPRGWRLGVYLRVRARSVSLLEPPAQARTYVDVVDELDDRSSNKMPAGVRAALVDIAQEEGEMGEDDARAYVARMEREDRLFEECWS